MTKNIFLIDKPLNWTSNDVVRKIKNITKAKKVGHGGTLDPLATGLLVIGVNEGTKLMQNFLNGSKKYLAEIEFGYATTTYDLEGAKTKLATYIPNLEEIQTKLDALQIEYLQKPPIFSALKKNGKKLYELARAQKTVEIESRKVSLLNYKILEFNNKILKIEVEVSKGFYVRSLAFDLGEMLNSASTLISLRRTKINDFDIKDAIQIGEVYDYWTKC